MLRLSPARGQGKDRHDEDCARLAVDVVHRVLFMNAGPLESHRPAFAGKARTFADLVRSCELVTVPRVVDAVLVCGRHHATLAASLVTRALTRFPWLVEDMDAFFRVAAQTIAADPSGESRGPAHERQQPDRPTTAPPQRARTRWPASTC